ncbi:hypothetical protein LguiA_031773 [Lonicera macranthoides]
MRLFVLEKTMAVGINTIGFSTKLYFALFSSISTHLLGFLFIDWVFFIQQWVYLILLRLSRGFEHRCSLPRI